MIYQVNNIKKDVRTALDEDRTSESLFSAGDIDVLKLDQIIELTLLEAVERVHSEAPYYRLEPGHSFQYDNDGADNDGDDIVDDEPRAIYWEGNDDFRGWLYLPDDFMRLVVFQMSDWDAAVYEAIAVTDPDYAKQRSRVKGIRGSASRPVVAIGVRPEGKVLEFYSCESASAVVTRAAYIPYPSIDLYGGIDICERCYKAVVYTAAGLTAVSCGDAERAKNFFEMAKTYLR